METLYVKTDGPVPHGMPITAGKVYKLTERGKGLRPFIISDIGKANCVCIPQCSIKTCPVWTFCDSTGTPVPAPWEKAYDKHNQPDLIDYRAHAERLAEAGRKMLSESDTPAQFDAAYEGMRAALSAYNQAKSDCPKG